MTHAGSIGRPFGRTFRATIALMAAVCWSCSGTPSRPSIITREGPPVLVGAGDIAMCGSGGSQATAELLDTLTGTVFTTGDNAYPHGSAANFRDCYEPTWGRHRARTRPVPGNHEYETPGAASYFDYFGENAGPPGLGYYRYGVGAWTILALNTEIDMSAGSAQVAWLQSELSAAPTRCTLAYFHRPLFSSGPNGNTPAVRELWRALYDAGADVVVNGHDHLYERFARQAPDGRPDPVRGIREFVVGTGGAFLYAAPNVKPNSEVRESAWGVIKLTLSEGSYAWEFLSARGGGSHDSGHDLCH